MSASEETGLIDNPPLLVVDLLQTDFCLHPTRPNTFCEFDLMACRDTTLEDVEVHVRGKTCRVFAPSADHMPYSEADPSQRKVTMGNHRCRFPFNVPGSIGEGNHPVFVLVLAEGQWWRSAVVTGRFEKLP